MRLRSALAVGLMIMAVTGVTACQTGLSGLNHLPGADVVLGLQCVDAIGPNSTREQIADAQLAQDLVDPDTGQKLTMLELTMQQLHAMHVEKSPEELRQTTLKGVYPASGGDRLPDGGDAAFAAAICDMRDGWAPVGLGSDEATVASTPNLLRSTGRSVCAAVSGLKSAESALKDEDDQAREAKRNPEAFKAKLIAQIEKSITELSAIADPTPTTAELIVEAKRTRSELAAQSADAIAKGLEVSSRIRWLAIEHDCPSTSRYGFGRDCGQFNPFPDGNVTGILKIKDGEMSCEDATLVVRWHYFPAQADRTSPLSDYMCEENGFVEDDDAPVYVECAVPESSNHTTVLVKPME